MTDPDPLPAHGRLAGIDFGTVRVGIAISDPDRILASPLETYSRRNESGDREYFCRLVAEERVVGFVVGLPVHMSGDESEKSRAARDFGRWLAETTQRPVCFQDERFTTSEADEIMAAHGVRRRRGDSRRDMLSAQAILKRYLETQSHRPPESLED